MKSTYNNDHIKKEPNVQDFTAYNFVISLLKHPCQRLGGRKEKISKKLP